MSAPAPGEGTKAARKAARREAAARAQDAWVQQAAPSIPVRTSTPSSITLHLGPTNSGKTHDALNALADAGDGTYAAPLRQLAHEAYERLSEMLPLGSVGLSTGEEQIDEHARVVCATVEKARLAGSVLVLDESHWVTDRDRGHHWTRLLLSGEFDHLHIIAAPEAEPRLTALLQKVARGCPIVHVQHQRLSRLDLLTRPVSPARITPSTLVVAFSRKAVYAVARTLAAHRPDRVGVLYGALPPATRRSVIAAFSAGELDVLVTTDVIGHGINVPAQTVLFAETTKFDGVVRRELYSWEAAQIAGRAGRYGLTAHGEVGILAGVEGLQPNAGVVRIAVEVARGERTSDLTQAQPRLRPDLGDLGVREVGEIAPALRRWHTWALSAAPSHGATADSVDSLILRLDALLERLSPSMREHLTPEVAWRLMELPVNFAPPRTLTWLELSLLALAHLQGRPVAAGTLLPGGSLPRDVEALEGVAGRARDVQALLRSFPGVGGLHAPDAEALEQRAAERITELLPAAIRHSRVGICTSCGTRVAPWFTTCADCHFGGREYW